MIREIKWYKCFPEFGFDTIEINRQDTKLYFDFYFVEKIKRYTHGYDLSIHSGTKGIFQPIPCFTEANLAILTAEIDLCAMLEAKQLVFHLNDGILSAGDREKLKDVLTYAKGLNIRMLYESNSKMVASHAYDVLNSFNDLGYVLDLGHLNNGAGNGRLGCEIDEFIGNVRDRIEYIHASNNGGTCDEHESLANGTLDWRHVLDLIDLSQVKKIIIEVRNLDMVESTFKDLVQYLESRIK